MGLLPYVSTFQSQDRLDDPFLQAESTLRINGETEWVRRVGLKLALLRSWSLGEGCGFSDRREYGDYCWVVGAMVAYVTASCPRIEFVAGAWCGGDL